MDFCADTVSNYPGLVMGALAQLLIGAQVSKTQQGEIWIVFFSRAGPFLPPFLAGAELDPKVSRMHWKEALAALLANPFFFPHHHLKHADPSGTFLSDENLPA